MNHVVSCLKVVRLNFLPVNPVLCVSYCETRGRGGLVARVNNFQSFTDSKPSLCANFQHYIYSIQCIYHIYPWVVWNAFPDLEHVHRFGTRSVYGGHSEWNLGYVPCQNGSLVSNRHLGDATVTLGEGQAGWTIDVPP